MQVGEKYTLPYSITPTIDTSNVSLSTDDNSVAKIGTDGTITALSEGNTTLNLTAKNLTKQIPLKVGREVSDADGQLITDKLATLKTRNITEIKIINPISSLRLGDEHILWAVGLQDESENSFLWDMREDNNSVKISSSDSSIISCQFGLLRANKLGTATITVSYVGQDISTSFDIEVIEEYNFNPTQEETYNVSLTDFALDNQGTTDSGLNNAKVFDSLLKYAVEHNYKKIILPEGTYNFNGDYGTISFPSNLIIDWNNSIIQLEFRKNSNIADSHNNLSGDYAYTMFKLYNIENCINMNGKFYAENYLSNKNYHVEHELTFDIIGARDCRFINCEFSYAPGFNVGVGHNVYNDTRTAFKLSNCEIGGYTENGENDNNITTRFRSKDFISLTSLNKHTDTYMFGLGCMQGYGGYAYVVGRIYNIYFYDENKKFISKLDKCIQFEYYKRPINSVYCKIEFYQNYLPTNADGDFGGVVHMFAVHECKNIVFEDCKFKYAQSTGLSPQGGTNLIIKNCEFIDCGYYDPMAQIDWEDGGQHIHGHLVENCLFTNEGRGGVKYVVSVKSRNIVMCNNIFEDTILDMRVDSENYRIFKNSFTKNQTGSTRVGFSAKTDALVAYNSYIKGISFNKGTTYGDNQVWLLSNIEI
ncbi:MAG: Ig-like domain-containing protein [Clostridia bacterium]